ncbi:MAG: aldehyde dehydrogenase family protein [Parvibaculales bacterium]
MTDFVCKSPADGTQVFAGVHANRSEIVSTLTHAIQAQKIWANRPLRDRVEMLGMALNHLQQQKQEIGEEITRQMGRPIRFSPKEVDGLVERGQTMLDLASQALADISLPEKQGFERFIRKTPVGVVAVLAPWNYPFLTSVNVIIPALAAGNSVILKHASQTPLAATRWQEAFNAAGVPDGVFRHLFLSHDGTAELLGSGKVNYTAFTGSVAGGHAIVQALSGGFASAGLELGGKDPAYVRQDADLELAVTELVDGAFFNSGQSCCGVERIYVHEDIYDAFLKAFLTETGKLKLGDPMNPETTLGPMVSTKAANMVRDQIANALASGATAHFPLNDQRDSPYLPPQVLTDVTHKMDVMREESFGPVIGIMPVTDDEEAIALMNDSAYGLTASIWSKDAESAQLIGDQLETGTVFLNRCDYLDPSLAWTGVKDSGRGCTLSVMGYDSLTRPKSFHLKIG